MKKILLIATLLICGIAMSNAQPWSTSGNDQASVVEMYNSVFEKIGTKSIYYTKPDPQYRNGKERWIMTGYPTPKNFSFVKYEYPLTVYQIDEAISKAENQSIREFLIGQKVLKKERVVFSSDLADFLIF